MRYCPRFPGGIPHSGAGYPRVPHPSATPSSPEENESVRLACVTHAASVCPEPGSNSPSMYHWGSPSAGGRTEEADGKAIQAEPAPHLTPRRDDRLLVDRRIASLIGERPPARRRLSLDRNAAPPALRPVGAVAVLLSTLQLLRSFSRKSSSAPWSPSETAVVTGDRFPGQRHTASGFCVLQG